MEPDQSKEEVDRIGSSDQEHKPEEVFPHSSQESSCMLTRALWEMQKNKSHHFWTPS